ncbi:helix-turn-helix transcriptional regulator [Actinorhabdospora filicis]|uniref:helix-turn-helix transcriptional regulator n=1 Tax=Actinorhabdospora filicis TaxID=1785913 RepID=UPI002554D547|nr:helix-turn-helix transcriptional regulator [Actinorhabdospora filicis]
MEDLAAFLRDRRARLEPAEVGVPTRSYRRVTGLRREEVAHLSGVSIDYYVRLEQGRAKQPSEQVLDALARALRLNDVEREHLHRLARPRREVPASSPVVRPGLSAVLAAMGEVPALILDHRSTVVAANPAAEAVYDRPLTGFNTVRDVFVADDDPFYADLATCSLDAVGYLRHSAGRYPDDERLAALVAELSASSARFGELWARGDVRVRNFGGKRFRHAEAGVLAFSMETFALPDGSERVMVVLTPDDEATRAAMKRLVGATEAGRA